MHPCTASAYQLDPIRTTADMSRSTEVPRSGDADASDDAMRNERIGEPETRKVG